MVSNEVEQTANGKFVPYGSLCFENMATRFVPLKNFVFRVLNGKASKQELAKQNRKNTVMRL